VAGASFYYVTNTKHWPNDLTCGGNKPGTEGIKVFTGNQEVSLVSTIPEHLLFFSSETGVGFNNYGFQKTYPKLREGVLGSRFIKSRSLYLDCGGYTGSDTSYLCTAGFVMPGLKPGIFVFSGLAEDCDGSGGGGDDSDDEMKGYVAAALAIEEAKSPILVEAQSTSYFFDGADIPVYAIVSVSLVPGTWRREYCPPAGAVCIAVDVRLSVQAYSEFIAFDPWAVEWAGLGVSDFYLTSADGSVYTLVDVGRSGCERADAESPEFMEALWWYVMGELAGAFCSEFGTFFGTLDIIKALFNDLTCEDRSDEWGIVEGVRFYGRERSWGTTAIYVTLYFAKMSAGAREYWFAATVNSWIELHYALPPGPIRRLVAVHQNVEVGFEVWYE